MIYFLDGSNICQMRKEKEYSLRILLQLCVELSNRDSEFVCFFDANISYKLQTVKEKQILNHLLEDDATFRIVPGKNKADIYILPEADLNNGMVISNDQFREHIQKYPWIHHEAVPLRLFKGKVFGQVDGSTSLQIPDLSINTPILFDIDKLYLKLKAILKAKARMTRMRFLSARLTEISDEINKPWSKELTKTESHLRMREMITEHYNSYKEYEYLGNEWPNGKPPTPKSYEEVLLILDEAKQKKN